VEFFSGPYNFYEKRKELTLVMSFSSLGTIGINDSLTINYCVSWPVFLFLFCAGIRLCEGFLTERWLLAYASLRLLIAILLASAFSLVLSFILKTT
jgi:hypothetical protein